MVGGTKRQGHQPCCLKSTSADLFLDLHTVSAPSGEERTLDTAAQVERAALCIRRRRSRCAQPGVRWDVGALLSVKRRKAVSDSEAVRAAREA